MFFRSFLLEAAMYTKLISKRTITAPAAANVTISAVFRGLQVVNSVGYTISVLEMSVWFDRPSML